MFNKMISVSNTHNKKIQCFLHKNFIFFGPNPQLQVFSVNFLDINYTGKTYKWGYRKNIWKLLFNKSHMTRLFFNVSMRFKKQSKNKLRLFIINHFTKQKLQNLLYSIRRYNLFTHRGIKIKGNLFFKKKGKISTYRLCLIFGYYFFLF